MSNPKPPKYIVGERWARFVELKRADREAEAIAERRGDTKRTEAGEE